MKTSEESFRFGLGSKALVAVTTVILAATLTAGWAYHHMVSRWLAQGRLDEANHLAQAVEMTVADSLARGDHLTLRRVLDQTLHHQSIKHLAVLDAEGEALATRSRCRWEDGRPPFTPAPVVLASTRVVDNGRLVLVVRPVVTGEGDRRRVVGAVRMAVSAEAAFDRVRRAHTTVILLACGVVICAIPLGHWLVNRLMVTPIRSLVATTVRMAAGDFSQMPATDKRDELGLLARGLAAMGEQIQAQQAALTAANADLESEIRRQTATLNRTNDRLRTEMSERESFLRAVSHDLGAPLRNIAGMANMALKKARGRMDDQAAARLERIAANADVATELIQELLELSRIGLRPQPAEPVDMNRLLRDVREAFEFDLRQRGIRLDIGEDLPTLHVSRSRVLRLFLNLVDNAIKYMPENREDGRIEITCNADDQHLVFRVADNGQGIDPADRERVFAVFGRAVGTSNVPGKGIGLPTVKTIVTQYGGSIRLDNAPDGGAVFHVVLPRNLTCRPMALAAGPNDRKTRIGDRDANG